MTVRPEREITAGSGRIAFFGACATMRNPAGAALGRAKVVVAEEWLGVERGDRSLERSVAGPPMARCFSTSCRVR